MFTLINISQLIAHAEFLFILKDVFAEMIDSACT